MRMYYTYISIYNIIIGPKRALTITRTLTLTLTLG